MLLLKEQQGGLGDGRSRVWFFSLQMEPLLTQCHLARGHFLAIYSPRSSICLYETSQEMRHMRFPYSSDL